MAEQRPVSLAHLHPHLFARHRVGFAHVQRDHAVGMSGQHRFVGRGCQEVECEPSLFVVFLGNERQLQGEQGVNEVAFGDFDPTPERVMVRLLQTRDHAVQPARSAEPLALGRAPGPSSCKPAPRRSSHTCGNARRRPHTHGRRPLGPESGSSALCTPRSGKNPSSRWHARHCVLRKKIRASHSQVNVFIELAANLP